MVNTMILQQKRNVLNIAEKKTWIGSILLDILKGTYFFKRCNWSKYFSDLQFRQDL